MEVNVEIEESDILALNDHVAKHNPYVRRQTMLASLLMLPIAVVGGLMFLASDGPFAWVYLVASLVILVAFPAMVKLARRRQVRGLLRSGSNASIFGPQRIVVTPHELTRHHELGYSAFYWRAVDRIEVGRDHAFVFVSSMSALIVPKRGLAEATFERFVELVDEYVHNSRSE